MERKSTTGYKYHVMHSHCIYRVVINPSAFIRKRSFLLYTFFIHECINTFSASRISRRKQPRLAASLPAQPGKSFLLDYANPILKPLTAWDEVNRQQDICIRFRRGRGGAGISEYTIDREEFANEYALDGVESTNGMSEYVLESAKSTCLEGRIGNTRYIWGEI